MKILKKISDRLFSTSAAGLYMILFALAIAVATFIENDYGTSSAQKIIFQARWFELLLLLFGISIVINIFRFRMIQQKKWAILSFHAAMIIILVGAAVTRYTGFEGMMHIREGSSSNTFLSSDTYLVFEATHQGKTYKFNEPVLFATLGNNHFEESYLIGNQELHVETIGFMPNPEEVMVEAQDGIPVIKVVIGGANGREEYYVQYGRSSRIRGTLFNFGKAEHPMAFNIKYENGELLFKAPTTFSQTQMATQQKDTLAGGQYHPLLLRSLYSSGNQSFVFGDFSESAQVELNSTDQKMASNSMAGIKLKVSNGSETVENFVFGTKGMEGRPRPFVLGDLQLSIAYGSKNVELPFALKLRDFIMEKYPGTNSASSYASEVTLVDPRHNVNRDQRIFMNNILNYDGYRFFQSSFDQDELGTYLSVNHDWWGTWISYLGYAILTLGMILTFFSEKSRFRQLARNLQKMRETQRAVGAILIGLCTLLPMSAGANAPVHTNSIDLDHAKNFGTLVMQDHRGRMKPMNTYASEILRKLSRKESLYGLTAEQVILGMAAHPTGMVQYPIDQDG